MRIHALQNSVEEAYGLDDVRHSLQAVVLAHSDDPCFRARALNHNQRDDARAVNLRQLIERLFGRALIECRNR